MGDEGFPLAEFTPSRVGFDSPVLHHQHYSRCPQGDTMNKLKADKQEAAIRALVEGASIRSVERMTGAHRDTITRLMVNVGTTCGSILGELMRGLTCERIELDEVCGQRGGESTGIATLGSLFPLQSYLSVYVFVVMDNTSATLAATVPVLMLMTAFGNLRMMVCMRIRVSVGSNQ